MTLLKRNCNRRGFTKINSFKFDLSNSIEPFINDNPISIHSSVSILDAMKIMEDRSSNFMFTSNR